ncbi:hyaluronan and proteoglycan link protein 4-like [Cyclopterus lumpus]|uniref:hyaluronan and proteoglycan link protein 4-like n=1 Tax=Cyclopterus lumpus TaxID=8103 RepID=UPI001486F482|nr:hyaluronan and proteoglycan link protein 4-like [Cyclopterus lumpus]
MSRRPLDPTGTALYLGLVLTQWVGEGGGVRVLGRPGQPVSLPCPYHYEDHAHVSQLSVQWRSPVNELLCHYIKHRAYRNCTAGYAVAYRPGSITLSIQRVHARDFGAHVCSVSEPHEFSDYSVELVRMPESFTSAPKSGGNQSGLSWLLVFLLTLFVCSWR